MSVAPKSICVYDTLVVDILRQGAESASISVTHTHDFPRGTLKIHTFWPTPFHFLMNMFSA